MNLLDFLTWTGTFVFAVTGALKARASRMDIFGAAVLAFATAYGGGTLRDLLIGVRPVNWINDNIALLLVFAGTGIVFLRMNKAGRFARAIFFSDAIGLGIFTATGIEVALRNGLNDIYALTMGIITATFGGLIADILRNEVPNLLKKGELYATACAIGGAAFLTGRYLVSDENLLIFICVGLVVGTRIYSKRKRLSLPEI
jgi:uncharacterized membrane protein YeiH